MPSLLNKFLYLCDRYSDVSNLEIVYYLNYKATIKETYIYGAPVIEASKMRTEQCSTTG